MARSAEARVKAQGSAKHGAGHFIAERVTSIALVPLSLWAVYAVIAVAPVGYEGAITLLQSPFNALMASLLIFVSCVHMEAGMRVIIEDYIHKHSTKLVLLLLNAGACWLGGALGVFSILKVALLGVGA